MHKIDVLNNLPEHLEKQCIKHWKKTCREEGVCIRFEDVEVQNSIMHNIFETVMVFAMAAAIVVLVVVVGIITSAIQSI